MPLSCEVYFLLARSDGAGQTHVACRTFDMIGLPEYDLTTSNPVLLFSPTWVQMQYYSGVKVKITGLKAHKEYNGEEAIIIRSDGTNLMKWSVSHHVF
jgi:hypothetical protein